MQVIAPSSEILHESQRQSPVSDNQISSRGICKHRIVPVQERKGRRTVQVNLRESLGSKGNGKCQIGIRHQSVSFENPCHTTGTDCPDTS